VQNPTFQQFRVSNPIYDAGHYLLVGEQTRSSESLIKGRDVGSQQQGCIRSDGGGHGSFTDNSRWRSAEHSEWLWENNLCLLLYFSIHEREGSKILLQQNLYFLTRHAGTCPCSSVVNALGRHVQWSATHLRSRVQSSIRVRPPSTKELFQIIPTYMMVREIIQGKKKKFNGVLYNSWTLLTPWVAASRLFGVPAWLKLKSVAGHWLVQHTAPLRANPDGMLCLEEVHYRYPTSCSLPSRFLHPAHRVYTSTHPPNTTHVPGLAHWATTRSTCWGAE